MTKKLFRATNGAIGKTDYDNASHFNVQKIGINHLADLCDVLFIWPRSRTGCHTRPADRWPL